MGFWATYWSTLLKGVRITALKERFEIRSAINNLRKADHILYKSLFTDVEKTHRVTKASREEKDLVKKLKISSEKAYSLIFNLTTEEFTLLGTTEDILKQLDEFSNAVKPLPGTQLREIEKQFGMAIVEAVKEAESQDRKGMQNVMLIIEESEENNPKRFMSAVRLAFQRETQQTFLAKFAARQEIRRIKIDILELQKIPRIIEGLTEEVKKRLNSKQETDQRKFIDGLFNTFKKVKEYLHDAFLELFLIKKRDMLLILKVLLDLYNLRAANIKWARQHFIPNSIVLERNKEIKKIQEDISKHFHIVAQAFRIMISRIQRLEAESKSGLVKL